MTDTTDDSAASEINSGRVVGYEERREWLLRFMSRHGPVDVMNAGLVDAYAEFTGAKVDIMLWGANKCGLLRADLRRLQHSQIVVRHRIGLGANWQPGFPKWVNSYSLSKDANHD